MEERLQDLRGAVDERLGWVPKTKTWLVPVLVGGMAVRRLVGKRRALKGRRG